MSHVDASTTEAEQPAPDATPDSTAPAKVGKRPRGAPPLIGRDAILSSEGSSPPDTEPSIHIDLEDSYSPGSQSETSSKPYRRPRDLVEMAAQMNDVATLVLNGNGMTEAQFQQIRVYANLARTTVQAMGVQVQVARITKVDPTISLELEDG